MKLLNIVLFLLLTAALPHVAFASVPAKSTPLTFLLQPQAKVLYQDNIAVNDHVIALGKYRKSANRWSPESLLRLQGSLQHYTLELPRDYEEKQVFEFYLKQIPRNAEPLFACEGRGCGQSNNWANDHFGVKQLYGSDASQYYAVFKLDAFARQGSQASTESATQYAVIYTVRRGNRRIYTQLEIFTEHSRSNTTP